MLPLAPTQPLPAKPGTYALLLHLASPSSLAVGKAGTFQLACGYYLYVGSAFGPGGLRARLGRHIRGSANCRWHIDYLRQIGTPVAAWFTTSEQRCEHAWADILGDLSTLAPLAGLGASDCKCRTHLFYSTTAPTLSLLTKHLQYADITVTQLTSV